MKALEVLMQGFYPEESVEFSLDLHAGIPAADRPTFQARFLTARERIRLVALIRDAVELERKDPGAALDRLQEALAIGLCGWRNVRNRQGKDVVFNPMAIGDVMDYAEAWQLYTDMLEATKVRIDQLKKSASPSPSSGEHCASDAPSAPTVGPSA